MSSFYEWVTLVVIGLKVNFIRERKCFNCRPVQNLKCRWGHAEAHGKVFCRSTPSTGYLQCRLKKRIGQLGPTFEISIKKRTSIGNRAQLKSLGACNISHDPLFWSFLNASEKSMLIPFSKKIWRPRIWRCSFISTTAWVELVIPSCNRHTTPRKVYSPLCVWNCNNKNIFFQSGKKSSL